MDSISIRPVGGRELDVLLEIQKRSFSALWLQYRDQATNPAAESMETIRSRFLDLSSAYYFIVAGADIVGAIRVIHIQGSDVARISPICVLPEYQRLGIGTKAMELMEQQYADVARWELGTIAQETGLRSFYERLGFRDTGGRQFLQEGMDIMVYEKYCR